jgi:hypothetical protein
MMQYHQLKAPMRTTLDIDDDILAAVKEIANRQCISASRQISRLLREALTGRSSLSNTPQAAQGVAGFQPFASQGLVISNAQIDALRDSEGV